MDCITVIVKCRVVSERNRLLDRISSWVLASIILDTFNINIQILLTLRIIVRPLRISYHFYLKFQEDEFKSFVKYGLDALYNKRKNKCHAQICKWGNNLHTIMIFRNRRFNIITVQNLGGIFKICIFVSSRDSTIENTRGLRKVYSLGVWPNSTYLCQRAFFRPRLILRVWGLSFTKTWIPIYQNGSNLIPAWISI